MEQSQSKSPFQSRPPAAPAAALLRPPAGVTGVGPDDTSAPSTPASSGEVEPDGTEDPWANADDGVVPEHRAPVAAPSPVFSKENRMHKPQDVPPVEVPPLDPTPPQDPIPHQNPTTSSLT